MKILIIDTYGESVLDWALRCQDDGHDVIWHVPLTPRTENIGKGLVKIVRDWREYMRWADLVFLTDNTKYLAQIDAYRKDGPPIVGPSVVGASWELDRYEGMRVLKRAGIDVPPCKEFSDYDEAIRFVKKQDRPFVSKPCGVEGDKSLSYCAKTPADLVFMLERWKKAGKLKGSFLLQDYVKGTEVGVGGWFGPGGWNAGWEVNVEHKKLFPGEIGPNTGEMGTAMWFTRKSKIADKLLKPLTDQLEKIGYVGCIDVNAIADDKGQLWPLEFTCRPGWPAFNIQMALMKGDRAEWMLDLANGRDANAFVYDKVAIGAVIGLPDMPYDKKPILESDGFPIYGVEDSIRESLHPCMVRQGTAPCMAGKKVVEAPCWVSSGTYVMVITGTGDTVRDARKSCYANVDKISMPGSPFYRNDIGAKLRKSLPTLKALGLIDGPEY